MIYWKSEIMLGFALTILRNNDTISNLTSLWDSALLVDILVLITARLHLSFFFFFYSFSGSDNILLRLSKPSFFCIHTIQNDT